MNNGERGKPKHRIDRKKLPRVLAVDAGVLMRAIESAEGDDTEPAAACRALFRAMEKAEREIIIPAPAFAEYLRKRVTEFPSRPHLYTVAFDDVAAALLAEKLPLDRLKGEIAHLKQIEGPDAPGALIKYDAMIVACAVRWEAERIVSVDDRHMPRLAEAFGIDCWTPERFYGEQTEMDLEALAEAAEEAKAAQERS